MLDSSLALHCRDCLRAKHQHWWSPAFFPGHLANSHGCGLSENCHPKHAVNIYTRQLHYPLKPLQRFQPTCSPRSSLFTSIHIRHIKELSKSFPTKKDSEKDQAFRCCFRSCKIRVVRSSCDGTLEATGTLHHHRRFRQSISTIKFRYIDDDSLCTYNTPTKREFNRRKLHYATSARLFAFRC